MLRRCCADDVQMLMYGLCGYMHTSRAMCWCVGASDPALDTRCISSRNAGSTASDPTGGILRLFTHPAETWLHRKPRFSFLVCTKECYQPHMTPHISPLRPITARSLPSAMLHAPRCVRKRGNRRMTWYRSECRNVGDGDYQQIWRNGRIDLNFAPVAAPSLAALIPCVSRDLHSPPQYNTVSDSILRRRG